MLRGSNTLLRQCVLQSSSSSSSASANASALCIRRNQRTQMRTYVFLPSSYKELQHDLALWLTNRREKRTILVKLMKDSYQETKTRIRRRTRTMKLRPPSQNAMSIKYRRWGNRLHNILVKRVTLQEYSRDDWFDSDGYPLTSRDEAGRFVNPWSSESTNGSHSFFKFMSWRISRLFNTPVLESAPSDIQGVPVNLKLEDPDAIRFTWIGHSTCVLQLSGYTLLTDPHFSQRAAPLQASIPFNGVGRHVQPACDMDDLSDIDVCLLTHDHYDHLDRNSCLALKDKIGRWIVPLGIKEWLIEKCEVHEDLIEELQWWDSTQLVGDGKPPLDITCAPTQHWASRTMWDRNQRLWCSFVVESQDKRVYFGGDTGLPESFPLFSQIGQRLGPFDLAALPIGAYSPRFFMADSHCDPSEAVQIHQQIRSKKSVAIHWSTFRLADEDDDEPRQLLEEAVEKAAADFSTLRLGESIEVKGSRK